MTSASSNVSSGPGGSPSYSHRVLFGLILAAAIVLRIKGLTEWSISDDEVHTLRDSLSFSWSNDRPLVYALNHYIVLPLVGLRELGLRLVPFLAGAVAVPGFYLMYRRLGRTREGLVVALLVAFSAWHLYWSQFARYYTLVFLFTGLFGLALLLWLQERDIRWIGAALLAGVLATLAHPSAAPVIAVGLLATAVVEFPDRSARTRRVWLGIAAAVIVLASVRFAPMLAKWFEMNIATCCHGSFSLLGSFLNWMTAPVLVLGIIGCVAWVHSGLSREGVVIASCAFLPLVGFAVLAELVAVSTSYVFGIAPFFLFGAAWLVAGERERNERRPGWMVAAAVALVAASANLVGIASHYRDGGRLPYREATEALIELQGGSPRVVAEGPAYLEFYDPEATVAVLPHDSTALDSLIRKREFQWVLAPRVARAGFGYYQGQFGSVYGWLDRNCRFYREFGTPRLDFRENYLELYQCDGD